MKPATRQTIEQALSLRILRMTALAGGDINQAWRVEADDGRVLFVKTNPDAPCGLFSAEARGLRWLSTARALAVPHVVAVGTEAGAAAFLALELLEAGHPCRDFDEQLGTGLAQLHGHHPSVFGLDHDNFIGSLPQCNEPAESWAEFYGTQRIGAQLRLARDQGRAPDRLVRALEALIARLPELVGDPEPPARLHGDLWSGNLHRTANGEPALIDPAVYGGHREIDLAMMRLFGGFSERVFDAYNASYPLAQGYEDRRALYQLYPLLVHLNLFGGHYGASALRAAERYL